MGMQFHASTRPRHHHWLGGHSRQGGDGLLETHKKGAPVLSLNYIPIVKTTLQAPSTQNISLENPNLRLQY